MKKKIMVVVLLIAGLGTGSKVSAQAQEFAQLVLNVEKLAQFRQILEDLKKGYEILNGGYNAIRNVSQGNFQLHKVFLDGLMEVSPTVKKYKRVADIIDYQIRLLSEYKAAFARFKAGGWFTAKDITYMENVYSQLFELSLKNLDDLFTVLTANKLRMSDDERLAAIDKIFADMQDKLYFLRSFNNSNAVLSLQRAKEQRDVLSIDQLYKKD